MGKPDGLPSTGSHKKRKVKLLSCARLLVTPWTAAHQAPPSMGQSFHNKLLFVSFHCFVLKSTSCFPTTEHARDL